jgi:hypothetical protein
MVVSRIEIGLDLIGDMSQHLGQGLGDLQRRLTGKAFALVAADHDDDHAVGFGGFHDLRGFVVVSAWTHHQRLLSALAIALMMMVKRASISFSVSASR